MPLPLRPIVNERGFRFGDLFGEYSTYSLPPLMNLKHDLNRFGGGFFKYRLKDCNHEVHRRVVVVQ